MDAPISPMRRALWQHGISLEWFKDFARVSERTVYNWQAALEPPGYAQALIDVACGWLPYPGWQGYQVRGPWLHIPGAADPMHVDQLARAHFTIQNHHGLMKEFRDRSQLCFCRKLAP